MRFIRLENHKKQEPRCRVSFERSSASSPLPHPYLHSLLPDGLPVSDSDDAELTFVPLSAPTTEEIEELTLKVARRLTAVVERLCGDVCETEARLEETVGSMQDALAASVWPPLSPMPELGLPGKGRRHPRSRSAPGSPASPCMPVRPSTPAIAMPSSASAVTACALLSLRNACSAAKTGGWSTSSAAPGRTRRERTRSCRAARAAAPAGGTGAGAGCHERSCCFASSSSPRLSFRAARCLWSSWPCSPSRRSRRRSSVISICPPRPRCWLRLVPRTGGSPASDPSFRTARDLLHDARSIAALRRGHSCCSSPSLPVRPLVSGHG